MKHLLLSCILFFVGIVILSAQQKGNRGGEKVEIRGKVVDVESEKPLEYATITLFSQKDSSLITGGITDIDGKFSIPTRPGSFFVKVEFISFKARYYPNILLDKNQKLVDLGTIALAADATTLQEVEVRAEKSQMQMSLDKRVFNVGKDLANTGGTAENILDNVPSVTVDIEGNVSLRGSSDVRILINGKPSGMVSSDNANGLRQLPANLIDKVEVITNPSARYEAEGMTGIINIVLRKQNKGGLNGSFDFNVGHPDNYGTAFNLNYRKKKYNLFASYGLRYRKSPGSGSLYQEFFPADSDTTFITSQTRTMNRGGWSNSFRFGTDIYINAKNTITGSFNYRKSNEDNFGELFYRDFINQFPSNPIGITNRTDNETEDENNLSYTINYKKTFDRKGQVLTFDLQFENEDETEGSDYLEQFFLADGVAAGQPDLRQRSNNKEGEKMWLFQTDYVHPFSEDGKFEIGARSTIRNINNDYLIEEFQDNAWVNLTNLSNNFVYDEKIHAVYTILGNKINKFSYQLGLRVEYSDVTTELLQNNEINARDYFNLFPSAHFTYDLPGQNAIQLSYSRRLRRPRFRDLNPFFTFSDARNIYSGNPDLDPEFTHSIELGHVKYWDKASLSSSVYYRRTTGLIQRIRSIDEEGFTRTRPENLSNENAFGLEFTYSVSPVKWWKLNGDLNFYRAKTDGGNLGENFQAETYTMFGRATSRMTIWQNIDLQLRVNYRAPRETTQGRNKSITSIDLGASKDILQKKGTLTLSVRDLFNSRKRRYIAFGDDFYSEGDFQWRARSVTLTLNYRLNQKKQRNRGGRRGGYDGGEEF